MQEEASSCHPRTRAGPPCCILAPLGACPFSYPRSSLGTQGFPGKGSVVLPRHTQREASMSFGAASLGPSCSHSWMPRPWPGVARHTWHTSFASLASAISLVPTEHPESPRAPAPSLPAHRALALRLLVCDYSSCTPCGGGLGPVPPVRLSASVFLSLWLGCWPLCLSSGVGCARWRGKGCCFASPGGF